MNGQRDSQIWPIKIFLKNCGDLGESMERDTVEPTAGHIILSGPDASEQQQNIDHR